MNVTARFKIALAAFIFLVNSLKNEVGMATQPTLDDNYATCISAGENFRAGSTIVGCILCIATNRATYLKRTYSISTASIQKQKRIVGTQQIFDKIYNETIWSDAGGGSGFGSDKDFARVAGSLLKLVIYMYGVTSLLDAPCGAVSSSWTRIALQSIRSDIRCFRYHGVDVVRSVIQRNKESFMKKDKWVRFSTFDLSLFNATLPSGYQMILSRDALQHLSYDSIAIALYQYCRSDSYYLLVGSYVEENENKNISNGDCFKINLLQPPFSLPLPLESFAERGGLLSSELLLSNKIYQQDSTPIKYLLLYRLDDLCASQPLHDFMKSRNTY